MVKNKPKVAFICVHNSCRSQIAEALGKKLAADVFESYSAGTEIKAVSYTHLYKASLWRISGADVGLRTAFSAFTFRPFCDSFPASG